MSAAWTRYLQTISNIGILVVAALMCFFLFQKHEKNPHEINIIGKKIPLNVGVLDPNRQNVVFVISTTCHFCKASLPFYGRLNSAIDHTRVKTIAILPQDLDQDNKFLESSGVHFDQVISMPLTTILTSATPTILSIDNTGIVKKVWIGQLDSKQESSLLLFLRNPSR